MHSFIHMGKSDWSTMLHSMQTCIQNGVYTPQESSTAVKEDSLLMQLLKVREEQSCIKEKGGKFGWDQLKRVYFCCLISKGKGRFLKVSDKHGLGKTHVSILSGETSLGRLWRQGSCCLRF